MSRDQLSPGKSLSTFYYALCRLNRSQISLEVGSFLERSITHSNQLDLSFCPGILGSCNLLDHQALSVALSLNSTLEYNKFFSVYLPLKDVSNKRYGV